MSPATDSAAVSAVDIERELRDAVSVYSHPIEIEHAIENAKLYSALAKEPSDRARCLMRLVALHARRAQLSNFGTTTGGFGCSPAAPLSAGQPCRSFP